MDRGKWKMRGEVRKWTDVPLQQRAEDALWVALCLSGGGGKAECGGWGSSSIW
jgi:hypothetical protein